MNTRTVRKALVALGVVGAVAVGSLPATGARATPHRNAAAVIPTAANAPRQLPADPGGVSAFAFDPADPNIVYAATSAPYHGSHVYESSDAGGHWRSISRPGWSWIGALASDPKHPGTLYASTSNGIHKTTDAGRTWQVLTRGLLPPSGVAVGEGYGRLAIDPNNSNIIYSGLGLSVHKSLDAGHTWQTVAAHPHDFVLAAATQPTTIYAAWFDPSRPVKPYTKPYAPALALESSIDGGKTWQRTRLHVALNFKEPSGIYDFAADPGSPTTIYAALQARIFMSTNAGQSWRYIGQGLPKGSPVDSLAAGAGTLYAAFGKKGVYETTDQGQTWTQSWPQSGTAPGLGVSVLAIDPARPTTIYASASYPNRPTDHILRSTDSGHTWTVVG